jgi:hypothetical protein
MNLLLLLIVASTLIALMAKAMRVLLHDIHGTTVPRALRRQVLRDEDLATDVDLPVETSAP